MLRCGKHRGASFAQAAEDRGYSAWVASEATHAPAVFHHLLLHPFLE